MKDKEIEREETRMRWIGHMIVFAMVCYFAYKHLRKTSYFSTLDYAMLPFHEAGHFFFMLFGQTASVAGGTIVQFFMPLAFAIYFGWWKKEYFSAMVAAFWLSQTLLNIAVYMMDARKMIRPVFASTDDYIHDWNYLFGKMHLLHRADIIGEKVEILGRVGIWTCLICMVVWLVRTSPWWPQSDSSETEEKPKLPGIPPKRSVY
jgi:hypothetical protein